MERSRKTRIGSKRAESLLFPIAAFLTAGGLSKVIAQKSFAAALAQAQKVAGRRIEHIGHPTHYADIVGRWAHDPRFVDAKGHPRQLQMDGKDGLKALIRSVDPSLNPRSVLTVLTRYGNVRRTRAKRYTLIRPFFFTSSQSSVAFEPMAYFLSDASSTLSRILKRNRASRGPELFWRKVETKGLSESAAIEFIQFVAARSLVFLEEIDDWLEARRSSGVSKDKDQFRRVGLGLFSIYSNPELPAPAGGNSL